MALAALTLTFVASFAALIVLYYLERDQADLREPSLSARRD